MPSSPGSKADGDGRGVVALSPRSFGRGPRPTGAGTITTAPDARAWAEFVTRHPDGRIFHTPAMHAVFAATTRHRPRVWAVTDADGSIAALLPVVEISALGGPLGRLTTRAVAFAGPLVAAGRDAALTRLLAAYQRSASRLALFTELRYVVDVTPHRPQLDAAHFQHEGHLNFLVDLSEGEDAAWARISSSARRNISKAGRMGVAIEEASTLGDIDDSYEVLREVYHRIQVPLPDRSLFAAAFRLLGPTQQFVALLARVDGRTIGVLTLLFDPRCVTYWYTGTLREFSSYRAGDALVWHAIRLGIERGLRQLDFGGAGRPGEPYGVRDFKAKYGGQLVDFGRGQWTPSPLRLRMATAGYERLRRLL